MRGVGASGHVGILACCKAGVARFRAWLPEKGGGVHISGPHLYLKPGSGGHPPVGVVVPLLHGRQFPRGIGAPDRYGVLPGT